MHVLTVFAKDPRLGHSKSRLARTIGDEPAFAVAKALLTDTLEMVKGVRAQGDADLTTSVFFTPDDADARQRFAAEGPYLGHEPQQGASLGERMNNCFETWFARHADRVVIIGTDCPTIGAEDIEAAFNALRGADVVLGPAADGGYYLVGLSSRQSELFHGIEWSSPDVLAQTVARIRSQKLSLRLLPTKSDLDTVDNVRPVFGQLEAHMAAMSPRSQATYWTLQDLLTRKPFQAPPFEVVHFDEIAPVDCPCGHARRAFAHAADFPATVHQTEITLDARPHHHQGQTEVYFILDCDADAAIELNGERHPVRVGSSILIRPGCVHRAIGQMRVLIVCTPKFDPRDEFIN